MTKQEFIEEIAKAAKKYAPKYGIKVVSPVIAQACLESGYGTSDKAKHHNYFGMKYRKGRVKCHSGFFHDGSLEQEVSGEYVPTSTDWYAFASLDAGVEGYFQFIDVDMYKNLKKVTDPRKYLELIKADGYATSLEYVKNAYKMIEMWNLTKYDKKEEMLMGYTNSPLVSYTKLSPNHSGQRTHAIDRITPHCVVGQCSVETLGNIFYPSSRQASCNYGIGVDGRVGMYCEEKNRSWCSSSNANDQRAITIECASDATRPYAFNDTVYAKLIELCTDICKRYGKTKLLWFGDKTKTLNYEPASDEMVLTVHRWFANKSCPGDWMYARMGDLAFKVTAKLGDTATAELEKPVSDGTLYRVQVGAYLKKENADNQLKAVKAKGFDAFITQVDGLYKVQVGAYSVKANAEARLAKVKAAGFDAFITTKAGTAASAPAVESLKVGDKVKLQKGAPCYGKSIGFQSWVYDSILYVREINGSRVVISTLKSGAVTGAVDKKYLTKI